MQIKYMIFKPVIGFYVVLIFVSLFIWNPLTTFGQNAKFIKPTTAGSLKVQIEPTPKIIKVNTPIKFKISFFKSPGNIQPPY
jgi:hypothetical protein